MPTSLTVRWWWRFGLIVAVLLGGGWAGAVMAAQPTGFGDNLVASIPQPIDIAVVGAGGQRG
ncbi:MAG: hypothetical protein ACR2J8_04430, partial [Thermomicrobiales bacterium]